MSLIRYLLASVLAFGFTNAHADKLTRFNFDRYAGGGLWSVKYSPDEGPDYSMVGAMIKAGYEIDRNLAVEAHLGLTESDSQNVFGDDVEVSLEVTTLAGVFGRYSWLHEEQRGWARFYALLGFSVVDVEARGQGNTGNDSDTSVSFGVGMELFGSDHTAIALEWVRYIQKQDYTIETPMVGLVYRF